MARTLLQIEIEKVANGYVLSCFSTDCDYEDLDETFLAGNEKEARLYLESWVKTWFKDHQVELIQEVT